MIKNMVYRILQAVLRSVAALWQKYQRRGYKHIGKNVIIGKNFIGAERCNISIGDNTSIGPNCVLYAGVAPITIGKNVMFGPNVVVASGDHRIDIVGEWMRNITNEQKLPENDKPVVIEDDVWIAANVVILKGVTIGRGSVVAAGAVVRKNVPPYTIYISDTKSKPRFTEEQIKEHEKQLKEKYGV